MKTPIKNLAMLEIPYPAIRQTNCGMEKGSGIKTSANCGVASKIAIITRILFRSKEFGRKSADAASMKGNDHGFLWTKATTARSERDVSPVKRIELASM